MPARRTSEPTTPPAPTPSPSAPGDGRQLSEAAGETSPEGHTPLVLSRLVLENGVPHPGQLAAAQVGSYRLYVPAGGVTGVRVTLTPLSGAAA